MKFAFVVPRYGAGISGGPEHACRLLAEQVSGRHSVDVLTTCARDGSTWKNEYSEGADKVRGVVVRRFAVSQPHDRETFQQLSSQLAGAPHGLDTEREWVRRLGPTSPALIEYLKRQQRVYDAVVFFSLYHATTVFGIAAAPDRAVLFPHLKLDGVLRFGIWGDVFKSARAVGYLSAAERRLARAFVRTLPDHQEIVGVGIDTPMLQTYPRHQQDPADDLPAESEDPTSASRPVSPDYLQGRGILFRRRHRLYDRFVLYGGRVAPDNGCEEMLDYFDSYASTDGDTALVLMGVKLMQVPEQRSVRLAGVLPDRERMLAYEAADVTLAPEANDLTATAVLESFAVGTPVLAAAGNDASVDHCRQANAGLYYATREEFVEALRLLMTNARLRERLGDNGRAYIRQHHRWEAVLGRFEQLVMRVRRS